MVIRVDGLDVASAMRRMEIFAGYGRHVHIGFLMAGAIVENIEAAEKAIKQAVPIGRDANGDLIDYGIHLLKLAHEHAAIEVVLGPQTAIQLAKYYNFLWTFDHSEDGRDDQ